MQTHITNAAMAARDAAYRVWVSADEAWQRELVREFPKDASTARYQAQGVSTPRLNRLHQDWHKAGENYRAAQADYMAAKDQAA